jgi:N-acetylglutamate synthase-like GNAT family acetyltransferase
MRVRLACSSSDASEVKTLYDKNSDVFGFQPKQAFKNSVEREEVIVCERAGKIIGYLRFRDRRDMVRKIYDMAVRADMRRRRIGAALINAVLTDASDQGIRHIALKCPEFSDANKFYKAMGFRYVGSEKPKTRTLFLWEKETTESKGNV